MSCWDCKYAPKTYEEYCMCKSKPDIYCPDAFTEVSHLCGNYDTAIQGAYDSGYNCGYADAINDKSESGDYE